MGIAEEIKTELKDLEAKVEQALHLQPSTETQPQAPSTVTDPVLARLDRELEGNPNSFRLQQERLARVAELAKAQK